MTNQTREKLGHGDHIARKTHTQTVQRCDTFMVVTTLAFLYNHYIQKESHSVFHCKITLQKKNNISLLFQIQCVEPFSCLGLLMEVLLATLKHFSILSFSHFCICKMWNVDSYFGIVNTGLCYYSLFSL